MTALESAAARMEAAKTEDEYADAFAEYSKIRDEAWAARVAAMPRHEAGPYYSKWDNPWYAAEVLRINRRG